VSQAANGGGGVTILEEFRNGVGVALMDVVSGHGVMGWWLH